MTLGSDAQGTPEYTVVSLIDSSAVHNEIAITDF